MFMRPIFFLLGIIFSSLLTAQTIPEKITAAYSKLTSDDQLKFGIVSLYVIDSKTGSVIFEKNKDLGLAAASTQKVITASTAYELLGHNYTYKTTLGYTGNLVKGTVSGNLVIGGSGDPTLGSWRYNDTKEDKIVSDFNEAIYKQLIGGVDGGVIVKHHYNTETIPDGWIWEDLGSYYGAGASDLIWRENQYDVLMKSSGTIGDTAKFVKTIPARIQGLQLKIEATAAAKGSGDRSYIFQPSYDENYHIRGTIPINEDHFTISGSIPHPDQQFAAAIASMFPKSFINKKREVSVDNSAPVQVFYTHISPPLDSIAFWFLKRSINLYGEALIKTIAHEKTGIGSTDTGVNIIKSFWKTKGIDPLSINMKDGSGLSPGNRITANALVSILQYDIKQPWFDSFLNALPEINGLKMKSGSIGDVLSYTGFAKSAEGNKYTFAIIVNNYNGSYTTMRQKMWKLLDILK